MRTNLYKGGLVAAALCIASTLVVASPKARPSRTDSTQSKNGVSAEQATNLLKQIQQDAVAAKNQANELSSISRQPFVADWHSDSGELRLLRTQVNDMDKLYDQLRANQSAVLPWQRKALDTIAPTLANLTGTTETAIVKMNSDEEQEQVYYANLHGLAHDIAIRASQIAQEIKNLEQGAESGSQQSSKTQVHKTNS